jgi:hypothetical protein
MHPGVVSHSLSRPLTELFNAPGRNKSQPVPTIEEHLTGRCELSPAASSLQPGLDARIDASLQRLEGECAAVMHLCASHPGPWI